ncbi:hypothetical protein KBG31_03370 [Patescibacteria group bacterium]|nr:hypothetical protein [Patescibacteria group bacterium]
MLHLITYDLNQPVQKYPDLYEKLKGLGKWCHPLNNIWFVITSQSSKDVRNTIQTVIDSNDELFVLEIKTPTVAAWVNLTTEDTKWLKEHL